MGRHCFCNRNYNVLVISIMGIQAEGFKLLELQVPSVRNRFPIKGLGNRHVYGKWDINLNFRTKRQCIGTLCEIRNPLKFLWIFNGKRMGCERCPDETELEEQF